MQQVCFNESNQSKSVQVWPHLAVILIWGPVTLSPILLHFLFYFFVLETSKWITISPHGCAHLIPSGRGEKHHRALGILCLKMVICQLEQILREQGR